MASSSAAVGLEAVARLCYEEAMQRALATLPRALVCASTYAR